MKKDDILAALFTSKARIKILEILFESQEMYEADIVHRTILSRSTVVNELKNLTNIGLLRKRETITRTYYSVEKKFVFYNGLKAILSRHSPKNRL